MTHRRYPTLLAAVVVALAVAAPADAAIQRLSIREAQTATRRSVDPMAKLLDSLPGPVTCRRRTELRVACHVTLYGPRELVLRISVRAYEDRLTAWGRVAHVRPGPHPDPNTQRTLRQAIPTG